MSKFDATETNVGEVNSYSTVQEPYVKPPLAIEGLTGLFQQATKFLDKDTDRQKNKVASRFRGDLLRIVDGVDQKGTNPQVARTAMRALFSQYNENYGTMGDELTQVYNTILNTSGMGQVISQGQMDYQRKQGLIDTFVASGRLSPNHTEAEVQSAINEHRSLQAISERYTLAMQTLELEGAQSRLTAAQQTANANARKSAATQAGFGIVPYLAQNLSSTAAQLQERVRTEEGYNTRDALADLERIYEEEKVRFYKGIKMGETPDGQPITFSFADMDEADRAQIESLFDSRFEMERRVLSGELDRDTYKTQLDTLTTQQELLIRQSDPEFSRFLSVVQLLGDKGMAMLSTRIGDARLLNRGAEIVNRILTSDPNDSETLPVFSESGGGVRTVYDILGQNEGEGEEAKNQRVQLLSSLVEGVSAEYSLIERNPKKAKELVTFLASPEFWTLRKENPEAFGNADGARELLSRHYADEVFGLVQDEFTNKNVAYWDANTFKEFGAFGAAGVTKPATQLVGVRASDTGVEFVPIQEGPSARQAARELNTTLRPIVNSVIRADAHLRGKNDYKAGGEAALEKIFGMQGPAGGDEGDNLTIKDFLGGLADTEPLTTSDIDTSMVGKIEGPGFTHGRKMESVEGMIIHHTAGTGEASDVARVLQERGLSVHYVVDKQGRVVQLMDDSLEAWHAGKNNDSGYDNRNTVGVEIIAHDDEDVTPAQVEATKRLIKSLSGKYGFDAATSVFGHGEVATHKQATEGMTVVKSVRG